jgi:NAD(P)H-nitrite reductase large subunit
MRNQTARVTIITQEAYLPYNRPMLTKGIARDFGYNGLAMEGPEWYEKNNIDFVSETVVLSADTASGTVSVRYPDGSEGVINYDKLIYALGAYCFVPPIKGSDLGHVVSVRSLSDTERVRQIISERGASKAVCIGGGVMGLEGAWGLKEGGLDVTVLETAPGLLPRQLDDTASEMLKELCIDAGVDVVTGVKIAEITENAVVLEDGTEYEAQLVIMSTGMRPYTKVAEDSGIAVDKWVTADSHMRTNITDVYTAGDCCSVNGQPQAFWAQAVETGRIAGANAAGDDLEYKSIGSSLVIEAMNTSVFALGTNGKEPGRKFRSEQIKDDVKNTYSKYYYDHGRLVGAILIGDISGMGAAVSKMK